MRVTDIDFRQNVYLQDRVRLTTARRLSAYMSSTVLATTTASSYYLKCIRTKMKSQSLLYKRKSLFETLAAKSLNG